VDKIVDSNIHHLAGHEDKGR